MNKKNPSVNKQVDGIEFRMCIVCKEFKPLMTGFYKSGKHHSTSCRPCKNLAKNEWYNKNLEHVKTNVRKWYDNRRQDPIILEQERERSRRWNRDNIDYVKEYKKLNNDKQYLRMIASQYSITPEDYIFMLEKCGNKCQMCKYYPDKTKGERLNIDHCHTTGKVRGLLCGNCNRAIGLFKDNRTSIFNAYKYLYDSEK